MPHDRTITNPLIKDQVSFLTTSEESKGKLTWIRVRLAPSGSNELHYHDAFEESFIAREGTLAVEIEGKLYLLENGASKTVARHSLHRFYNPSQSPIEFDVKIEPANRSFEEFLQIMYGLAADGKTNKKGIPTNIWVIGAISQLGATLPPRNSLLHRLAFVFRWLGGQAEKRGVLAQLKKDYVKY